MFDEILYLFLGLVLASRVANYNLALLFSLVLCVC